MTEMFGLGTIINVGVAVFSLGLNKKVNAGKYRVCICRLKDKRAVVKITAVYKKYAAVKLLQ